MNRPHHPPPRPAGVVPSAAKRMERALCAISLAMGAWLSPPTLAQVELRGTITPLDGEVVAISPKGVEIKIAGAPDPAPKTIGWDRVRRVAGRWAPEASPHAALADALWRARARLERGDRRAAERGFEDLALTHAGLGGPSGAVLAEGLLRVRMARGAQAQAVAAWLWWLETRAGATPRQLDNWLGGRIDLPPITDETTGLVPRLPPIFSLLDNPAGVRLLAPAASPAPSAGAAAEMAALYRAAAAFEAEPSAPIALPAPKTPDDAVQCVFEIVASRAGTPDERKAARAKLVRRVATALVAQSEEAAADAPSSGNASSAATGSSARWIEAWCRAAIGRSLLREGSPAETRQGVIEMLHVPARFADLTPELARLVLADAAQALAAIGETAAAATLKSELARRFGPGLADEPIMDDPAPTGDEPGSDDQGAG